MNVSHRVACLSPQSCPFNLMGISVLDLDWLAFCHTRVVSHHLYQGLDQVNGEREDNGRVLLRRNLGQRL